MIKNNTVIIDLADYDRLKKQLYDYEDIQTEINILENKLNELSDETKKLKI